MKAREVLRYFSIDRISELSIENIAFGRGLRVEEKLVRGAEGRLLRVGKRAIAIVDSNIKQYGKKRFVLAHELGHYELHNRYKIFICDEAAFLDWYKKRPEETEANVFAAELLMPEAMFKSEARSMKTRMETIFELASHFRVTRTASAIRYASLDIAPCVVVFSQKRRTVWYVASDSFRYKYISTAVDVHPDSGAGEFFGGGSFSTSAELTPCEFWFTDFSLVKNDRCYEQIFPMEKYNAVLSLIW